VLRASGLPSSAVLCLDSGAAGVILTAPICNNGAAGRTSSALSRRLRACLRALLPARGGDDAALVS
jgi:hypothetical protein